MVNNLPQVGAPSESAVPRSVSSLFSPQLSQADKVKRKELTRMKRFTTGLLLVAALIFIICLVLEKRHLGGSFIGYVKAAAEAGMVGGMADWFAVTALFKQPFGLNIPHTAIIPRKKDQIGDALSSFVNDNFLTPDNIASKVATLNLPEKASDWLTNPGNSTNLGNELAGLLISLLDSISDSDAEQVIQNTIINRIADPEWGPPLGKLLTHLLDENRHLPLINILATRAFEWAQGAGDTIDRVVNADMPKWAPKFVNSLLGYKIHSEVVEFTRRVKEDPQHDMRKSMGKFLYDFAYDLQNDHNMIQKVEGFKEEILARDEVKNLAHTTWSYAKRTLSEALSNPESALRVKFVDSSVNFGKRLREDEQLSQKLNGWIDKGTRSVVKNYAGHITSIITETVTKWDAADASEKIELQVGRDLQFIRINGTIVGALAGLVIYSVAQLIGLLF